MPVIPTPIAARADCMAAPAITRATSSETAPFSAISSAGTPSRSAFAALLYVITPRSKYALEPGTSVSRAESWPPVHDSATAIVRRCSFSSAATTCGRSLPSSL